MACVAALLFHAGAQGEQGSGSTKTDATAEQVEPRGLQQNASGGPSSSPAKAATMHPLTPLARGRTFHVKPLNEDMAALEIVAPANFKLRIEGENEDESLPRARLTGSGLEIFIAQPDAGFFTASQTRQMTLRSDPAATVVRSEETEDGFLMIDLNDITTGRTSRRYDVVVSRPQLKVNCEASAIEKFSDAELVASICLTLRTAKKRSPN